MTITLHNITCAPNVVDKSAFLNGPLTISNVRPNDPCDMLNPSLVLDWFDGISNYNYVYIDTFDRYYFITGTTLTSGKRCVMSCAVDVLHTYHADITKCTGTVLRSESIGKPTMISDSKLPIHTNERTIDSINFPDTPFTRTVGSHYILTTIGGSPSSTSEESETE